MQHEEVVVSRSLFLSIENSLDNFQRLISPPRFIQFVNFHLSRRRCGREVEWTVEWRACVHLFYESNYE